jgi:hypothetical protein
MYLDNPRSSGSREWYGNKKDPDLALLPRFRALSDILWGFWVRDNPNVKNIRYFFMLGISNDQTQQLIASCLKNAKKELSAWPGVSFNTGTDEGHALLGTSYIHSCVRRERRILMTIWGHQTAQPSHTSSSNTRLNSATKR